MKKILVLLLLLILIPACGGGAGGNSSSGSEDNATESSNGVINLSTVLIYLYSSQINASISPDTLSPPVVKEITLIDLIENTSVTETDECSESSVPTLVNPSITIIYGTDFGAPPGSGACTLAKSSSTSLISGGISQETLGMLLFCDEFFGGSVTDDIGINGTVGISTVIESASFGSGAQITVTSEGLEIVFSDGSRCDAVLNLQHTALFYVNPGYSTRAEMDVTGCLSICGFAYTVSGDIEGTL